MVKKATRYLLSLLIALSLIISLVGCATEGTGTPSASAASPMPPKPRLRVATTTSLYDTGLWEYLEPMFEEKYGVELDVMYAGTGKALELGRRGDVDIITVHSQADEEQFIADGYGVERIPFAYNYFLIVGPAADPAGIKGLPPEAAFGGLMREGTINPKQIKFVSRGDDSGTHSKEKAIWKAAGYEYETVQNAGTWYIEAGTGMGSTLMMASEKEAYTLTDLGTYLAYQGRLELVPIVDKGSLLRNVYSAIAVNPENVPETKIDLANNLIGFLTSPEIQEIIGNYGVEEYGRPLFTPGAGAEPK